MMFWVGFLPLRVVGDLKRKCVAPCTVGIEVVHAPVSATVLSERFANV